MRARSLVLLLVLIGSGFAGCGGDKKPTQDAWKAPGAARGLVRGQVLDSETGAPLSGAAVRLSTGETTTTRSDGTFELEGKAGRARLSIEQDGFLRTGREVAISEQRLDTSFRIARRAPAQAVSSRGGMLTSAELAVEVPAGAYGDNAQLSLTYLSRAKVAAVPASPQWVDGQGVPRRVLSAVAMQGTEQPNAPVRMRVPVPPQTPVDAVTAYAVDDNGVWSNPIAAEAVENGVAIIRIPRDGQYGVAVDALRADGKAVGYMVLDPGDPALDGARRAPGDVVQGDMMVATARRGMTVVDPQGTTIDVPAASRVRLAPPSLTPTDGKGMDPVGLSKYAGSLEVMSGQARVVAARRRPDDQAPHSFAVRSRTAAIAVKGTAFTVSSCAGAKPIDRVEVVEGTVETFFKGTRRNVSAGEQVTFCDGCAAGSAPMCEESADAGVTSDAATLPDANVVDAARVADAPVDAAPVVDAVTAPDAGMDAPRAMARLSVTPSQIDFGRIAAGSTSSMPVGIVVTNLGEEPTGPLNRTSTPANSNEFTTVDNDCNTSLAPGASCRMSFVFAPTGAGTKQGQLTISAMPGGDTIVNFTGVGLSPARLVLTPNTRTFDPAVVGSAGAVSTFTLKNEGEATTGVITVAVGGDRAAFPIDRDTCRAPLVGGGSCEIDVRFAPPTAGTLTGTLDASGTPGGTVAASLVGQGLAPARLVVAPDMRNFGPVVIGGTSVIETFTITNGGGTTSATIDVNISGPDANTFSVMSNNCGPALAAGASCSVTVAFLPTAAGARTATLQIATSGMGTLQASLSGTGMRPAAFALAPGSQDFGGTVTGTAKQIVFTLTNTGDLAAPAPAVSLTGTNATHFTFGPSACGALGAGASCEIPVSFAPTVLGALAATLAIEAQGVPMVSATLAGTGTPPAAIAMAPAGAAFGTVAVNATSAPQRFIVANRADAGEPTGKLSINVATGFVVTGTTCSDVALAPGASCYVDVAFKPLTNAATGGLLSVTGAPGGTISATLSGQGAPQIGVMPTQLTYGAVSVGANAVAKTVQLKNQGTTTLFPSFGITGDGAFTVGTNSCGNGLIGGATCTVDVHFLPGTAGLKTGTLQITSPGGPAVVSLTGEGTATAALEVMPTSHDFGAFAVGTHSSAQSFTFKNTGGSSTGGLTTVLGGADGNQFEVLGDACSGLTLPSDSSCVVQVKFFPTATRSGTDGGPGVSATLTVAGSPGGSATVTLTGTVLTTTTGADAGTTSADAASPGADVYVTPSQHSFGQTTVGVPSVSSPFTFINNSNTFITGAAVMIGGVNDVDFEFVTAQGSDASVSEPCSSIPPGGNCTVHVRFNPLSNGTGKLGEVKLNWGGVTMAKAYMFGDAP